MLDYRIETFLTLCETRSYTKASDLLHITQPTVTQHIQFLEKKYGVKLFEYSGKMLHLTYNGEKLRQFAISIRANCLEFMSEMTLKTDLKPEIQLGATKTIGEYVIPSILKKYLMWHPTSNTSLYVDNTTVLLDMLEKGEIKFAFIEGYFNKSNYEYRLFRREQFIGVCGKDHPLADKEITFEDLLGERIFIREKGSGTRDIAEQILNEHSFSLDNFRAVSEVSNFQALKQMIEGDLGITFLYKPVVQEELKQGILRPLHINGFSATREFNFVYLKNSLKESEYLSFLGFGIQEMSDK